MKDLQPTYILHSRPYSNTSRILEAFTREHGRIALLAKGIRRGKNSNHSLIQLFTPILITWAGKGELQFLKHIEPNGLSHQLTGRALLCGFYLNELLIRLLHKADPHPYLFQAYQESLQAFEQGQASDITLRLFEKHFLQELGYALNLTHDAQTHGDIHPEKYYHFNPSSGFHETQSRTYSQNRFLGAHLLSIHRNHYDDKETRAAAKRLFRQALEPLLGHKPLKTRELFVH